MIRFSVTDKGILVKKSLFSSLELPFNELALIIVAPDRSLIRTKSGEEYISKSNDTSTLRSPLIYDQVKRYNIGFEDRCEADENTTLYTHDEVLEMIGKTESAAQEAADRILSAKLGTAFSASINVKEDGEGAVMFFRLMENGSLVSIDPDLNNGNEDSDPYSFDDILLSYLCRHDPALNESYYGVVVEMLDEERCRKTVEDFVDYFCEVYIAAKE